MLSFKLDFKCIKHILITAICSMSLDKRLAQKTAYFTTKHVIMILTIMMAIPNKYLIDNCMSGTLPCSISLIFINI